MLATSSPLRGARRTYRLGAGLALTGLALTAGVLGAALATLSIRPTPAHRVGVLGQQLALPAANVQAIILLSLATLGIAVVLAGARGALTLLLAQRRLRRALPVAGPLAGHEHVWVLHGEQPHAFCAGLLRPAVYVTTGALRRLSGDQLAAVLAHEHLHRARRDPLRIVSARVLGEALFFFPVLRGLTRRYCTLAELAADDHAVAALDGDRSALAAAMLAFEANGIAPERVDHMSGLTPDWRLPIALTALSLLGATALALLVWQLGRHAILQTTLAPPVLSAQPCVVILALVPLAGTALGMWATRRC
jgi:Zn-dependent protease with chaperone function